MYKLHFISVSCYHEIPKGLLEAVSESNRFRATMAPVLLFEIIMRNSTTSLNACMPIADMP